MKEIEQKIQERLFLMQDLEYKVFHCRLIPSVDPNTVIGVRTLELRNFAKELAKTEDAEIFLHILPHKYFEENNLHGFLIEKINDYELAIKMMDGFLPYVDNWATCDIIFPKVFRKYPWELYSKIKEWIQSDHLYTIRFGIGMLMKCLSDDKYQSETVPLVAGIVSQEYYVNMMIAWFFATALAKQYETALPIFQDQRLDRWTHNKAIQKAIESRRISDEKKDYLRTIKIK